MSKPTPVRLLLPLALLFALAQAAAAQAPVDARAALASLPDSQAVLYVNARRIVNEMLPKLMTPAEYRKMLTQAEQYGFDPRGLEFAAVGVRLANPPPANNLPEFVVVVRGGFNADTMLALGRVALGAQKMKSRQETYGSKTLEILDLKAMAEQPEGGADGAAPAKPGSPMPFPEVAVAALDSNTLVVGVPSYVRAAVDSAAGQGALKPSLVELAAHDPQALWSLTAELPPNLAEYLHKAGAPANREADEMIGWVRQVSIAQGMDALNYTLSAAVLTDAPEHASAFSGLVRMGLLAAQTALNAEAAKQTPRHKDYAQTRAALGAIKSFVNRTEGNTLHLSVSAPQKTVADLVRKELAPKPPAKSTRRAPRRGRARRR
jgi:hypothetical protein